MNAPHTLTRIIAAALLSGGLGLAGFELAARPAQAAPCSNYPGQPASCAPPEGPPGLLVPRQVVPHWLCPGQGAGGC